MRERHQEKLKERGGLKEGNRDRQEVEKGLGRGGLVESILGLKKGSRDRQGVAEEEEETSGGGGGPMEAGVGTGQQH